METLRTDGKCSRSWEGKLYLPCLQIKPQIFLSKLRKLEGLEKKKPNICTSVLQFLNAFQYSHLIPTTSEGGVVKMLIIRVQEAWGTLILGFITVTVVLRVQSQACCSSLRASSVLVKSCLMARLVLSSFGPLVMCRSLTFCRCGETQGQAIMRVLHHFSCEWRVQEESSSNRLTVCCFVFSVIVPLLIR